MQTADNPSTATGQSAIFLEEYSVLENLKDMTSITDDPTNVLLTLYNSSTHEETLLQTPDYVPSMEVDNTAYDSAHTDRLTVDGKTISLSNPAQMSHYHVNMASLLRIGEWLDYLREVGVYDNTRIIIVADHGRDLWMSEELLHSEIGDTLHYYPLFMVKDFNSHEFTTSEEFMTNADVITIATEGLIENPTNPFTGNPINSDEKTAHDQFIIASGEIDILQNNGNTFKPSAWMSVKEDMRNVDNWTYYPDMIVLDQHAAP